MASTFRRRAADLVETGLASTHVDVDRQADPIEELHGEPVRRDLARRLGLAEHVIDCGCRRIEMRIFISALLDHGRSAGQ